MRTNRHGLTVAVGVAAFFLSTPAVVAGETPSCGTWGDGEVALTDCRRAQEGATFYFGVKAERRQSTARDSIMGSASPLVEIDLEQFRKADESAAIRMSTTIDDSLLPRGYRRKQEAELATPSAYWANDVWAPTWSDFDLLLATPTAGPDPCRSR
jgi:hypothetical protein